MIFQVLYALVLELPTSNFQDVFDIFLSYGFTVNMRFKKSGCSMLLNWSRSHRVSEFWGRALARIITVTIEVLAKLFCFIGTNDVPHVRFHLASLQVIHCNRFRRAMRPPLGLFDCLLDLITTQKSCCKTITEGTYNLKWGPTRALGIRNQIT